MKTVINNMKLWKVEIDALGAMEFVVHGTGKKFQGTLTGNELEQICFRIDAITKGEVSFYPAPNDLVNRHEEDKLLLAEQNETIVQLREQLKIAESQIDELLNHSALAQVAKTEAPPASVHNVQDENEDDEPPPYDAEVAAIEAARLRAMERQAEV